MTSGTTSTIHKSSSSSILSLLTLPKLPPKDSNLSKLKDICQHIEKVGNEFRVPTLKNMLRAKKTEEGYTIFNPIGGTLPITESQLKAYHKYIISSTPCDFEDPTDDYIQTLF